MEKFIDAILGSLPGFVAGIILILVVWLIASIVRWVFNSALQKTNLPVKLADWGLVRHPDQGSSIINTIGQILYYLIWVIFLPSILSKFGLSEAAQPINNMINNIFNFIPTLFGAALLVFAGVLVARLVKMLVYNVALGLNIDKWAEKLNLNSELDNNTKEQKKYSLANVLGNIVFVLVLIPFLIPALEMLGANSVTTPIVNLLNSIVSAIPNILIAILLLVAGVVIARIVDNLLHGLLENTGINSVNSFLSTDGSVKVDFANLISKVVAAVIVLFFSVEAINALKLEVLTNIGASIISYIPNILVAIIVLGLGLIGGSMLATAIKNNLGSDLLAKLTQILLGVFSIFIALDQLKFGTEIVNKAFVLIVGGLSIAFAIAFGLGGRDFAAKQLEKLDSKFDEESDKIKANKESAAKVEEDVQE